LLVSFEHQNHEKIKAIRGGDMAIYGLSF